MASSTSALQSEAFLIGFPPDRAFLATLNDLGTKQKSGEVDEGRRCRAPQQDLARFPLRRGIEWLKELHFRSGEKRDRQAVAEEDAVAGERRQLRPRRQDAGEIE